MKFYLIKLVTNTQGQDADPSGTIYTDKESVLTAYHQALASYHNAADVLYAIVEVLDEYGRVLGGEDKGYREIVDHRPEPVEE